jgi:hypothetical protein
VFTEDSNTEPSVYILWRMGNFKGGSNGKLGRGGEGWVSGGSVGGGCAFFQLREVRVLFWVCRYGDGGCVGDWMWG